MTKLTNTSSAYSNEDFLTCKEELIALLMQKPLREEIRKLADIIYYQDVANLIAECKDDFVKVAKKFAPAFAAKAANGEKVLAILETLSDQDFLILFSEANYIQAIEDGFIVTTELFYNYEIRVINSGAAFAVRQDADGHYPKEKTDNDIYIPQFIVERFNLSNNKAYSANLDDKVVKVQKDYRNFDNVQFFSLNTTNEEMVVQVTPQPLAFIPQGSTVWPVKLEVPEGMEIKKVSMAVVNFHRTTDYTSETRDHYTLVRLFDSPNEVKNTIDSLSFSYHLRLKFPDSVLEQARSYGEEVPDYDRDVRRDLTHLNFVTIDGEDARDFDDAVYVEKKGENYKLYVAIADVSYYVKPEDELDKEAKLRTTSIYFPTQVIPMLPEELSNGLCSLNPDVKRYALCCEMELSPKGDLLNWDFYQACIISKKRFTYNQVQKIIESDFTLVDDLVTTPELNELCRDFHELYKVLAQAKEERGAVSLEVNEAKFSFKPDGSIKNIYFLNRKDAHKMIEEFMVAANQAAARFVEEHDTVAPHRNHDLPSEEKVNALNNYLAFHDLSVPLYPTTEDYRKLGDAIANLPERDVVASRIIQSFSRAEYSPEANGHFGLALRYYAQFTSPIRRYPDLLLHRAIKSIIVAKASREAEGAYTYTYSKMAELCRHCSEVEQNVERAYFEFLDWIKALYMERYIGETFQGVVSHVTRSGAFIVLPEFQINGFLSFQNTGLYDSDFILGSTIDIIVQDVNVFRKTISFALKGKTNTRGGYNNGRNNSQGNRGNNRGNSNKNSRRKRK